MDILLLHMQAEQWVDSQDLIFLYQLAVLHFPVLSMQVMKVHTGNLQLVVQMQGSGQVSIMVGV
jgi:hypothetical protein